MRPLDSERFKSVGPSYVRPIDGLRALAVLAVLVFHLNEQVLGGGFLGVDIFFVVSGFVVARSVAQAPEDAGLMDFVGWFYRRRFSRILPALLAVVLIGSLLSVLLIPDTQTSRFFELTGAAALLGLSNFLLLAKAGDYFSASSAYNPFTHTWSLAVEEQYYFLFPAFAYLLLFPRKWRSNQRVAVWLLFGLMMSGSLAAAFYFTASWRDFAFFMLPSRFWELGAGVALSVMADRRLFAGRCSQLGRFSAVAAGIFALVVIIWCLIFAQPLQFPFPWAIPAVLATLMLIISFLRSPDGAIARFFSLTPIAYVWRISYSLYLWHWVIIVLFRWTVGINTSSLQLTAACLSMVLAALSTAYIENPVRHSVRIRVLSGPEFGLCGGIAVTATFGLVCAMVYFKSTVGLSSANALQIWSPYVRPVSSDDFRCVVQRRVKSFRQGFEITFFPIQCRGGEKSEKLFVLGDSHAGAYERVYYRLAAERGVAVKVLTVGGCKFLTEVDRNHSPECEDFRTEALAHVAKDSSHGDFLFLPGLYLPRYTDWWDGSVNLSRAVLSFAGDKEVGSAASSIANRLAVVSGRGVSVIFELPKPILRAAMFRCSDWFNSGNSYCSAGVRSDRSALLQDAKGVSEVLRAAASAVPGAHVLDVFDLLCPSADCDGRLGGQPLFFDTDHLTGYANDLVYPRFVELVDSVTH